MARKKPCYVCGGVDPRCQHCPGKEISKLNKLKKNMKRRAINNRLEFLANIWIKCWKFAIKFNHPPRSFEYEARKKFGPWIDDQGRVPVPKEVKRIIKVGL